MLMTWQSFDPMDHLKEETSAAANDTIVTLPPIRLMTDSPM